MVTHEHSLIKHFKKRVVEIQKGSVVSDKCTWEAGND